MDFGCPPGATWWQMYGERKLWTQAFDFESAVSCSTTRIEVSPKEVVDFVAYNSGISDPLVSFLELEIHEGYL